MTKLVAEVGIQVPFYDVDVMEVAWHGHYLKYFEVARCALLRSFDYDYPRMRDSGYAWPIVECYLKFVRSARYGQHLTVRAELLEWESKLKIGYLVKDSATGERLTKGYTSQVAVELRSGELQFVSPQVLFEKLGRASSV